MKSTWKIQVYPYSCIRKQIQKKILGGGSQNCGGKDKTIVMRVKGFNFFQKCLGQKFSFWNGTKFLSVYVNENMIGQKVGSFVLTKRITGEIHRKNEGNKRKPFMKK